MCVTTAQWLLCGGSGDVWSPLPVAGRLVEAMSETLKVLLGACVWSGRATQEVGCNGSVHYKGLGHVS